MCTLKNRVVEFLDNVYDGNLSDEEILSQVKQLADEVSRIKIDID